MAEPSADELAVEASRLYFGHETARDPARAVELCRRAASAQNEEAISNLGAHLFKEKKYDEALPLLRAAAARGCANALCLLGDLFWDGEGSSSTDAAAIKCWQHAASGEPLSLAGLPMLDRSSHAVGAVREPHTARAPPEAATHAPPTLRVCIIGGGPSGLCVLKECLEKGFAPTVFEQGESVGGVFTTAYEGATLTSSTALTAFGAFPDGTEATPRFWSASEYVDYLEAYVERFRLRPHIHLNTRVVSVRRVLDTDHPWAVSVRGSDGKVNLLTFDAVAVCAGLHQMPNWPVWAREVRRPIVVHSADFQRAEDCAGKRVLVVGLGESGSDISLLLARCASAVAISTRAGPGAVVPRYADAPARSVEPADLGTNRRPPVEAWGPHEFRWLEDAVRQSTPGGDRDRLLAQCYVGGDRSFSDLERDAIEINSRFDNLPYSRFGTKNLSFLEAVRTHGATLYPDVSRYDEASGTVTFEDGRTFEACDVIVLCTGYRASFPFFEAHMPQLAERSLDARSRFKHIISMEEGSSLAFIGYARPAFGAVPPMSELAARYWVQLLSAERALPADAHDTIVRDRAAEENLFARDARRLTALSQYQRWMDELATLIGCKPQLRSLRLHHPDVWRRVIHSAMSGCQFRLHGPGATDDAWRAVERMMLPSHRRQPRCAVLAKSRALRAFQASTDPLKRSWLWEDLPKTVADPIGSPRVIFVDELTEEALETTIADAALGPGLLRLRGVGSGPAIEATRKLFDSLQERAPPTTDSGVSLKGEWLDDIADGRKGVASRDLKLVLDLESAQIGAVASHELFPDLCAMPTAGPALASVLAFMDEANARFMPTIHAALARAVGGVNTVRHEASAAMLKYRLCDYPEHPPCRFSNRCSAHTDYGTATLIFEDGTPGLEVWLPAAERWQAVPPGMPGDALLLFGWCSCVRSNSRVTSLLHRVVTASELGPTGLVPRRTSLVLFAAPPPNASISPVLVEPGEIAKYREGKAGTAQLQAKRAHKQE